MIFFPHIQRSLEAFPPLSVSFSSFSTSQPAEELFSVTSNPTILKRRGIRMYTLLNSLALVWGMEHLHPISLIVELHANCVLIYLFFTPPLLLELILH